MHTHKILEGAGLRPTSPRAMVLEFFRAHPHDHFTAEQVYRLLNGDANTISLSTVYRVLAQLVNADLLSDVAIGDSRIVYELDDGRPHGHIVCTACGDIDEFFDEVIEARQQAIAETHDLTVSGRQLILFGICSTCKNAGVRLKSVKRR